MTNKINSYLLTLLAILTLVMPGCTINQEIEAKTETDLSRNKEIAQDTTDCPVMESRNWHAWIDRASEDEARLNISGEIDLPTPGYQVTWQPGILDRRQPPTQRFVVSLTPPENMVIQVITPTKVNYKMPTKILEYGSVAIYCENELIAEIPDVTLQEKAPFSPEVGTFSTDELFAAGGGGCGMSLWQAETNPQQSGFLFFGGLKDSPAFIVFDGKMTELSKIAAEGEKFYGQQTSQIFATKDNAIAVKVTVNLGEKGESESVSIRSGTIAITVGDKTQELSVVGDAGC